ncbi:Protein CBG27255 [Caenorhabditis briggsae]|uniref:Protein CBG27255 n=1 Tax=Caenorhabditis briggsae TaxID=6238 RepID=B6IFX7_CAEBR|nr:Protein CBG27255 [Caenorhabditis briggsae]CAR98793.1 Protein CBG27255 [Caenorhabditis briggsae]
MMITSSLCHTLNLTVMTIKQEKSFEGSKVVKANIGSLISLLKPFLTTNHQIKVSDNEMSAA